MISIPFLVPIELAEDVTDVTDGPNFTPQTVWFSQFQKWAILKLPGFETGAAKWPLGAL